MDATFFARFTLLLLASSACPANAKDDAAKDDVKSSFLLTPINLQTGVTDISTDIYTQLLALRNKDRVRSRVSGSDTSGRVALKGRMTSCGLVGIMMFRPLVYRASALAPAFPSRSDE